MNRQAWRDFFITVFFLSLAFVIALLSSAAAEQRNPRLATLAAAVSLVLALLGALYIIPRLARNVRLEILRFAIRTTVTVEGLLFLVFLVVIAFAAWNTANNLLYLILSAMLAFLVAANLIARLSLADVSVQLRFPDHIFAGETASINVTLLNHKRVMPSYSLMIEALSESGEGESDAAADEKALAEPIGSHGDATKERKNGANKGGEDKGNISNGVSPRAPARPRASAPLIPASPLGKLAYFVLVPARSSARQRVEHRFVRRGRYPITGFRIATKFPAGFFKKWRRIDATGEILVYPKPTSLDDFYHTLPMLVGQIQSHARGSGDDLYAIRRYQNSDHMRNIDWKATAKSMEMMVREHTREDEWRLTIVFDTSLPPAASDGKPHADKPDERGPGNPQDEEKTAREIFDEKFEKAVVMAASLANHFILERADVELITTNDDHNVASGSGNDHLYKILRSLATIHPVAHQNAVEQAGGTPPRRGWRLLGRSRRPVDRAAEGRDAPTLNRASGAIAWRLLDEVPVLGDERRFKVLITSATKGTIPAHVWRTAHVVFMDDL
ncbi:MAG TPA: DUF58 domain-containing protein [Blastocatellia bacterium]|jgi:uncharacterized protein (DUF58 family)|nr:DUF58 domain-containing protein [Blastocatellia bacterium]